MWGRFLAEPVATVTDDGEGRPRLSARQFAERILFAVTLEEKLLVAEVATAADTAVNGHGFAAAFTVPNFPSRPPGLGLGDRPPARFPKPSDLATPLGRGQALHFFANHELLALELLACAVCRFPDAPAAFIDGLVRTMQDEQRHLTLYLRRMAALGVRFGDLGVNDFFWQALSRAASAYEFVAGMSLTLEQANLDFARHYRDLFRELGDYESAAVLEQIYQDEIRHVSHGLTWFRKWRPADGSDWQHYQASLHLPLSPARAKAEPLDVEGREAAGLDRGFIRELAVFGGSKGRPPAVHWFNPEVEDEVAAYMDQTAGRRRARHPNAAGEAMADVATIMAFLAAPGDVVISPCLPSLAWREDWARRGAPPVEFIASTDVAGSVRRLARTRPLRGLSPWAWGPAAMALKSELEGTPGDEEALLGRLRAAYAKTELPARRTEWRQRFPALAALLGPEVMDGRLLGNEAELEDLRQSVGRDLGTGLVIKAPFSAAGRARLRLRSGHPLTEAERHWLAKAWRRWGPLLAEPLVEVVWEGSLLGILADPDAVPRRSEFHCNHHGQYQGHVVGGPARDQPPKSGSDLLKGAARAEQQQGAAAVFQDLQSLGLEGRVGIDYFVYRFPAAGSQQYLQALGEINARTTMGHVAVALKSYLAPAARGHWRCLDARQALRAGLDFKTLATELAAGSTPNGAARLSAGCLFTNDPETARHRLGVISVGDTAERAVTAITAPGSP